jgi:hypothetical protein
MLSVWWLRVGIEIARIKPGYPQQNGCHERMHLTLKLETTKPVGGNFLQQQARLDDFIACYNNERPHQALNIQCPAERHAPSTRPCRGLPELDSRHYVARSERFELPTPRFEVWCSIQLSYERPRRTIAASARMSLASVEPVTAVGT